MLLALQAGSSTRPPEVVIASRDTTTAVVDTAGPGELEDCAVVGAAIDYLYATSGARQLVLRDSAFLQYASDSGGHLQPIDRVLATDRGYAALLRDSLGVDLSTIVDLGRRNATPGRACSSPRSRFNVWILHQSDRTSSGEHRANPTRFDQPYPGVIFVSRAGFSTDGDQALITVGNTCGGLCGAGFVVVLRRDHGSHWRVTRAETLWVS
jgi:hypothetical protein